MRKRKKSRLTVENRKTILKTFIKEFNEKWGGFLVIDKIKQDVDVFGYLNIEVVGRYFPASERGVCIHWEARSRPYAFSRSRVPPYEITYLFHVTSPPPLGLPLLLQAAFPRIRYSKVHKTPNPSFTLLKYMMEMFLTEAMEDFVNFRQFLRQPNVLETLVFLYHDLTRIAKGEYKGWYWSAVHRDFGVLRNNKDKIVIKYLLSFYKRGGVTVTTEFAIDYLFKSNTFRLDISHSDLYDIKEPFQKHASSLLGVVIRAVEKGVPFPEELKQFETKEKEALIGAIESLAHFIIDAVLPKAELKGIGEIGSAPLTTIDENRLRLLKAISLLISPTFAFAFFLNYVKKKDEEPLWSNGRRVIKTGEEPSSLFEITFSLLQEKPQDEGRREIKLKGVISYEPPSYRVVWEVSPYSGMTMTYSYPIGKDVLALSREEAKDLVLRFFKDYASFFL